jgi:flagellar motor switch protein FliM
MNPTTAPPAFDFRKPPPGDTERRIAAWLTEACRRAAVMWSKALPFPAEPRVEKVEITTAGAGLRSLSNDVLGFVVRASEQADDGFLFAVRRPVALLLLAGLMGEEPAQLPVDRELGTVERSLCEYMLRELFLGPMEFAWPLPGGLKLAAGTGGAPETIWRQPLADAAYSAELIISTTTGDHTAKLLFTRSGRLEQLTTPKVRALPTDTAVRSQIETLVKEMPVDVSVILGTADLTMYDLARLSAGDVVLLRQRVSEPLEARVAGAAKFRVWPGAVSGRCAVQVQTATN